LKYRSKIKFEKFTILIYPLEKYLIATMFDPDRKIIKEFKGLKYYPLNKKFLVNARLENIKNPEKQYKRSGIIIFQAIGCRHYNNNTQ